MELFSCSVRSLALVWQRILSLSTVLFTLSRTCNGLASCELQLLHTIDCKACSSLPLVHAAAPFAATPLKFCSLRACAILKSRISVNSVAYFPQLRDVRQPSLFLAFQSHTIPMRAGWRQEGRLCVMVVVVVDFFVFVVTGAPCQ